LPGTGVSTAQRKLSQGHERPWPQACEHAQLLTARTPWYGEGNSKTAHTLPTTYTRSLQAERAGPYGPEVSGIKAGWPRFGTKRGA